MSRKQISISEETYNALRELMELHVPPEDETAFEDWEQNKWKDLDPATFDSTIRSILASAQQEQDTIHEVFAYAEGNCADDELPRDEEFLMRKISNLMRHERNYSQRLQVIRESMARLRAVLTAVMSGEEAKKEVKH